METIERDNDGNIIYISSPVTFDTGEKATDTVYSDRLFQWDSKKHDALCKLHFGDEAQYWSNRDPKKIEAFLSDYTGTQIHLVRIEKQENASSGYPLWRFDYTIANATQNG